MPEDEVAELRREFASLRRRYDEAEALTGIGSWEWDVLSGDVTWSNGMYALLALQPGSPTSYCVALSHIHPDDRERYETALQLSLADGSDYYLENRAVLADGRVLDVISRGSVIRNDAGDAIRMVGSVQDVTAQKLADATLHELGAAIEQLSEGVIITDAQTTIEYVNPAVERLSGYAREELVGETPKLLSSGLHDRAFYDAMWAQLSRGESWTGKTTNKRKDGTLYIEDSTITPVVDSTGRTTKFVAVKRDVTKQLELEEKLRQGQELEAIGLLAGGVAHDFNNMLSVILGYSEVALDALAPDHPIRGHVEKILAAGESSAQLTRQLLAFSRKQVLQVDTVDLQGVIRGTDRFLTRVIGEDIELAVSCAEEATWVRVDRSQLENAVLNLATNAKHAMPQGGKLTIETSLVDLDEQGAAELDATLGHYARLAVRDTGTGMDEETLARIFEPFYTTKPTGKGTGLGLASVQGFVHQSGGQIRVTSELGQGSSFEIYLPTVREPSATDVGEEKPASSGGAETILLVEDHQFVRELNHEVLRSGGYEVLTATNGEEALRVLAEHPGIVDLVFTDIVMPLMNGNELAKQVRAHTPEIKLISTSGFALSEAAEQGILTNGTPFLQKPCSPRVLLQKVREVLDS